MADGTKIEWTDMTWNVVTGCSIVSPGCTNCYAMGLAGTRLRNHASRVGLTQPSKAGPVWTGEVRFNEQWLLEPLRLRRPRMIFVAAHGDLFHEAVPDEVLDRVFAVMALAPQHTFQVLTKRADRMRAYLKGHQSPIPYLGRMPLERIHIEAAGHMKGDGGFMDALKAAGNVYSLYLDTPWPLPNVWCGVSAEDQRRADERIPALLDTPAAVRWVSAEPLLGPINFRAVPIRLSKVGADGIVPVEAKLDWIVAGGESGRGARPMHPAWVRSIRDQCAAAGVPFLFKQWGEFAPSGLNSERWLFSPDGHAAPDPLPNGIGRHAKEGFTVVYRVGKKAAGRLLDGVLHDGYPQCAEVPFAA